ncbi:unnamed protein product [Lymnaea stagnalis]|uniref:RING-type E3 ubiquitin transferase n=1 Tax=Lymnaea stagnalis TaxID=6523 RepID=A0AAV2H7W9_LYMST
MDEKQINELLECSVCLERFDQSCKVLPCQHTFCRQCLDEIVLTHKELRCPECRALVTVRVADLPTNILVVRILEGLKTKGGRYGGSRHGVSGSSPSKGITSSPLHRCHETAALLLRQGTQPCAEALYKYESSEKDDLPLEKGDIVILRRQIDENWYQGELAGRIGFFPANFVQVLVPIPHQIPQCRALYDFDLKDEAEKDCLSFKKDELLTVIRRVDENWLEGRKGDKIGIFPVTFVELNDAARIHIQTKSHPAPVLPPSSTSGSHPVSGRSAPSTSDSIPPNSGTTEVVHSFSHLNSTPSMVQDGTVVSTSVTQSQSTTAITTSPVPISLDSISQTEVSQQNKHHSDTAVSLSSSPIIATAATNSDQQHRHSPELVVITDSHHRNTGEVVSMGDPQNRHSGEVTSTADLHHRNSAELTESASSSPKLISEAATRSFSPSSSSVPSSSISGDSQLNSTMPRNTSSPNDDIKDINPDSTTNVQPGSLMTPVYSALYNYKPQKEDELELHKGELYSVAEKCQDGWFKGACVRTGVAGVFPGNYVSMVRHSSAFKPVSPNVLNIRAKGPVTSLSPAHSSPLVDSRSSAASSVPAPPLLPRLAKLNAIGQKPRSPSSQLNNVPLRSVSSPGSSTSPKHVPPVPPLSPPSGLSHPLIPAPPPSSVLSTPTHSLWAPPSWMAMQQTMSASSNITPPNVIMAAHGIEPATPTTTGKEKKDKKEKEKKSLVKLLSGKSKKAKQPAALVEPSPPLAVFCLDGTISHIRSGSYPVESSAGSGLALRVDGSVASAHRKAASYDATSTPPVPAKPRPKPAPRERYYCKHPYPPQTEHELALEVGDIIHVHRKRDDGWYKGTQERTGKTGMFPASFVEKCD